MPAPELQEFFARIRSGDEGAVAERRHAGSLPGEWEPAGPEPDVGKRVEDQDFAAAIRGRLDESARLLLDLKAQGLTWQEIAARAVSPSTESHWRRGRPLL